ncbi:hypothetical protein HH213_17995 [Duganella dendranthematis]|uniref:Uncharacterized protein n=1 Tax=Duganella dendranthematis TaxID=2728021 RepID=A0ABX6MCL4_9BURK|nr:hypothetical protein [Duganella dendranthematis]QJD91815.1 hypothetical protein HH213_17995 [Duganella dendranthematis]
MASGKLGSADLPAGGADTLICTVAANQAINVRFANRNAVQVRVRLSIGTGANPSSADYVDYDVAIQPYGVLEDTGIAVSAGEKVWARSDTANVSVRAHGM